MRSQIRVLVAMDETIGALVRSGNCRPVMDVPHGFGGKIVNRGGAAGADSATRDENFASAEAWRA